MDSRPCTHGEADVNDRLETTTVYVYLLDENVDVWRPVDAVPVGASYYRIVTENNALDDERWEFTTGETVRCEIRPLWGGTCLVAVSRFDAG